MAEFGVGDRLKAVQDYTRNGVHIRGRYARVIEKTRDGSVRVLWEDREVFQAFVGAPDPVGGLWAKWWFELAPSAVLDRSRPITTAEGIPVEVTVVEDDKERPLRATVNGMVLSYAKDGSFIPGHQCKVDLVNSGP